MVFKIRTSRRFLLENVSNYNLVQYFRKRHRRQQQLELDADGDSKQVRIGSRKISSREFEEKRKGGETNRDEILSPKGWRGGDTPGKQTLAKTTATIPLITQLLQTMGTTSAMVGGERRAEGGRSRVEGFSEHRRHGRCSSNRTAQALIRFRSQRCRPNQSHTK